LSERRLLFGHHPESDRLPHEHVHGPFRSRSHGGLDRPVERGDRGSVAEDQPAAPALHGADQPRLRPDREALLTAVSFRSRRGGRLAALLRSTGRNHPFWTSSILYPSGSSMKAITLPPCFIGPGGRGMLTPSLASRSHVL